MNYSIEKLKRFYAEVDKQTERLEQIHAERLNCRLGCSSCCIDGITVWMIEAENICQDQHELLESEKPNENGGCAFLDSASASCRIYESRPYVCRTQGLPLRWLDSVEDETFEFRDICPLNENGEPIENLDETECWTIGDPETTLSRLQNEFESGAMRRIALRELFTQAEATFK